MAAGSRDCRESVREKWQSGSQGGPGRAGFCAEHRSPGEPGHRPMRSSQQRAANLWRKIGNGWQAAGSGGGREPLASRGQRYLVQGFRKLADRPHPLAGDLNRQPCLARLPQRATARENLGEAGSDTVMTPVFYPWIQTETLLYSVIILPSISLGSLSIQHGCARPHFGPPNGWPDCAHLAELGVAHTHTVTSNVMRSYLGRKQPLPCCGIPRSLSRLWNTFAHVPACHICRPVLRIRGGRGRCLRRLRATWTTPSSSSPRLPKWHHHGHQPWTRPCQN